MLRNNLVAKTRMSSPFLLLWSTLVAYFVFACTAQSINFENLSTDDLRSAGFYGYVLPDSSTRELGWERTISMESFDAHCEQQDTIERSNPVSVTYSDDTNRSPFSILITRTYQAWDSSRATQTVPLNVDWIPSQQGTYYLPESGGVVLRFEDVWGMEVVILSWLDVDSVAELIGQLQYVGPDPTTVVNPWENACK
jgi:hypothetical protein